MFALSHPTKIITVSFAWQALSEVTVIVYLVEATAMPEDEAQVEQFN